MNFLIALLLSLTLTNMACARDMEMNYVKEIKNKTRSANGFSSVGLYKNVIIKSTGKGIIGWNMDNEKSEIIYNRSDVNVIDNIGSLFCFMDWDFNIILFDIEKRTVIKEVNFLDDFKLERCYSEDDENCYVLHRGLLLDESRAILLVYNRSLGMQEIIVYDFVKKAKKQLCQGVSLCIGDVYHEKKLALFGKYDNFVFATQIYNFENETTKDVGNYDVAYAFLYDANSFVYIKDTTVERKYSYYSLVKVNFDKPQLSETVINKKDNIYCFRYYRDEGKMIASLWDPKTSVYTKTVLYEVK